MLRSRSIVFAEKTWLPEDKQKPTCRYIYTRALKCTLIFLFIHNTVQTSVIRVYTPASYKNLFVSLVLSVNILVLQTRLLTRRSEIVNT